MAESISPDEPQPSGAIIPSNPSNQVSSDLDPVEESLYKKIQLAQTPEEIQSLLNLYEQRQAQIERKAYRDFQLQETKNQIKFERKLAIYDKISATALSIISIIIGVACLNYLPLISPLLIILGLIKPLEFSIIEVGELIKGLNTLEKPTQELPADNQQQNTNKSNQE